MSADLRDDEAVELFQCGAHRVGARQADRRVGAQNPKALISPRSIASNIATAFNPSRVAMRGAFQKRRRGRPPRRRKPYAPPVDRRGRRLRARPSRWAGRSATAGRRRAPDAPGCKMALRIALTLSVPCADWFTPWLKQVTTRPVWGEPVVEAREVGLGEAASRRGGDVGRVPRALRALRRSRTECAAIQARPSRRLPRSRSNPGTAPRPCRRDGRCRSALSAVAVRRGSMATMRVAAPARAASCRW